LELAAFPTDLHIIDLFPCNDYPQASHKSHLEKLGTVMNCSRGTGGGWGHLLGAGSLHLGGEGLHRVETLISSAVGGPVHPEKMVCL